jgi:hypothetical protein
MLPPEKVKLRFDKKSVDSQLEIDSSVTKAAEVDRANCLQVN